jgi:hypothetical protein
MSDCAASYRQPPELILVRTFCPGLARRFGENSNRYFALNQSAMEIQQSRWFEYDRRWQETFRPDLQRTQTGDQPIQTQRLGARRRERFTIKSFDENGLRHHRTYTSRPGDPESGRNDMDEENKQIAHFTSYQAAKKADSGRN